MTAALALLGGPALSAQHYPLPDLAGLALLALIVPFTLLLTPRALGAFTTRVLIVVAAQREEAQGHT